MAQAHLKIYLGILVSIVCVALMPLSVLAGLDAPHYPDGGYGCDSCHDLGLYDPETNPCHLPAWDPPSPLTIDDTQPNYLCWSCHNDEIAPKVKTHSSINTSDRYGDWTMNCCTCHNQHTQEQVRTYGAASYHYSNTSDSVTETTIAKTGAGWDIDQFKGMLVIPNTGKIDYSYLIAGNTSDTLTVKSPIDLTQATAGDTFAISLGKLIKAKIDLSRIKNPLDPGAKTGLKTVRFFEREGANSFADGDITYDGICEVCHTETVHFQNDGEGSDPKHDNLGSLAGGNCMECHSHRNGFAHSGSSGSGCVECHGHDAGSMYDPGMEFPNDESAGPSPGRGTFQSHSTHTETDGDDAKGPSLYCDGCHDITNIPFFKDSGNDSDGDGKVSLAETKVCDPCHSPAGTYDGINDPVIGAKRIWKTGAYVTTNDATLRSDKQKWCAGCHDESPANIGSVDAPNIVGDEDGLYTYGTGWGYYKTGHGLAAGENYPSKGGIETLAGRPVSCDSCHDLAASHIDNLARTFDCSADCTPSGYRQGYRLRLVDGEEPMEVPWTGIGNDNSIAKYRLCVSCHDPGPFVDPTNKNTNMYTWSSVNPDWTNRHVTHLSFGGNIYPASYNYAANSSRITCVICHNVHGSTRLAMVRDGKLIGREPGQEIWYYNPALSADTWPPVPEDLPLSLSTAARWNFSSDNLCGNCHGSSTSNRMPSQGSEQWTRLDWTDEPSYTNDGAYPDSALAGSTFTFRVKYASTDTSPPSVIQLWIDLNDNDIYEGGEKFALDEVEVADTTYFNGKLYTINLSVESTGDDIIRYRFYAEDSGAGVAIGPATGDSSISLLSENRPPELSWVTGACRYEGVSPAAEVSGSNFTFSVQYADADGNCPPAAADIQVVVDGVPYDLEEVDPGDADCADGKEYARELTLSTPGETPYRFTASDGMAAATGEPTYDHSFHVLDNSPLPTTVCGSGCDSTSIQGAVDSTVDDQTILVYAGTYPEHVTLSNDDDNTIIRSVCGRDYTVIDPADDTYGIQVASGNGSVVDGFQITGGTTGVYVSHPDAHPDITLENCDIHTNINTTGSGGGVYAWRSDVTIRDSIIRNNTANAGDGGAIYSYQSGSTVTVTGSVIQHNEATTGGGYFCGDGSGTATFDRCLIIGNIAILDNGGGIHTWEAVNLLNTVVANNTAADSGGGIYVRDGGMTTASNCTIAGNTATSGNGGAFYNWIDNITVRNSILWNNTAPATAKGHISFSHSTSTVTVTDSVISNDNDTNFANAPYFDKDAGTISVSGFVTEGDPFFADAAGGDYHLIQQISSAIDTANAADATEYDIDGDSRPQGSADDIGADEYVLPSGNTPPVLAWTGESGYTEDGADPDDGDATTSFIFMVDYSDGDNEEPAAIELWADTNYDGIYAAAEKYPMDELDGDSDVTDGKRYVKSMHIGFDADGILQYRFFATDGKDEASGDPTANRTVILVNSVPSLSWTGETGYEADGVDPDSAAGGTSFAFKVNYTDEDNRAPAVIQVWVDENDSGTYEPDEKFTLTAAPAEDGNYANGEKFERDLDLFYVGDGEIIYRFYGADSGDAAIGSPASDMALTLDNTGNTSPVLSWTGEVNYTADGVDPESGETGSNAFTFKARYSDAEGDAPATMQLWLDLNDDGDFNDTVASISEKQVMSCSGSDYVGGVNCSVTLTNLSHAGDGYLAYRFSANDGRAAASGSPVTEEKTINVYHILAVSCSSIQDAIDAAVDGDLVLVDDCTYAENITFLGKEITVRSVNGPASTLIVGDGSDAPVVRFVGGEEATAVLEDFTIDNQAAAGSDSRGIFVGSESAPTIRGVIIKGNSVNTATAVDGAGIYINKGSATIESSIIGGDPANQNICDAGCGIYAEALSAPLTIVDSFVTDNRSGSTGSGIYLFDNGEQLTTISGTTIADNSATRDGGGIAVNNAKIKLTGSTLSGNESTNSGETGGALYVSGSSSAVILEQTDFIGNSSLGSGGALYMTGSTESEPLTVSRGSFTDNMSVAASGGAVYLDNMTNPAVFSAVVINGNSAAQRGGGMYLTAGSTTGLTNCILSGNSAGTLGWEEGGGIRNYGILDVSSCTIAGNYASGRGGGLFDSGTTTSRNSIYWGNVAGSSDPQIYGAPSLTYSDIEGGYPGTGNIDQNPLFVDPVQAGSGTPTSAGDFHIQSISNVIDQGTPTGAPVDDIDGDNRPQGAGIDMGADEYYMPATIAGTATAVASSSTEITVTMSYTGDDNDTNTYSVEFKLSSSGTWSTWVSEAGHVASPYGDTITGLSQGLSYDVRLTYNDADGVTGTNPQTVSGITLPLDSTTVGAATATPASGSSIGVTMPYSDDGNGNNTYTVEYKLSSAGSWSTWVTGAAHVASPYTDTITGLVEGESYDVRLTYNDADGVTGTNPQTVSNINLATDSTAAGTATAVEATSTSIGVSMPYTNDGNGTSTYTVEYKLSLSGTWNTWVGGAAHVASPYTDTITGLIPGMSYDVRMTYMDADGVTGTNPQTVMVALSGGGTMYTVCKNTHPDQPCDFQSVNGGIDSVSVVDGDILLVYDDTYSENINFDGKDITILSRDGAGSTTIEGDGSNAPVVAFVNGETAAAVLDDFTIDNQAANSSTRGVYIYGASPTVRKCSILGNAANNSNVDGINVGGGGIFVKNGAPVIDRCTVSSNANANRNGGGIYVTGSSSGTLIQNSTITGNSAIYGGGLYADVGLTVAQTDIFANTIVSYGYGGGIYLTGTDQTFIFSGGSITSETAQNGGGIAVAGGADLVVDGGAIISGNTASNGTGSGMGGGVYINGSGSTLTCSKVFFTANDADQYGGAFYNTGGGLTMTNCNITGNTADGQTYSRGGGIYTTGSTATVDIYSSTIAGNYAYYAGGGFFLAGGASTLTNSIIWGNTTFDREAQISGSVTVTYSEIQDGYGGTGNIDSEPYFVDPVAAAGGSPTAAGDFHICAGVDIPVAGCPGTSGAINAGTDTDAPADDIDGDARTPGAIDMGADEYVP